MKTSKRINLAAVLLALTALAQPLFATVIYQDTFSGAAATMNGRVPDTVSNGTNWSSPINFQFAVDGGGNGVLSAPIPNGATNGSAGPTLPFTPDGSSVYVLSVDVLGFGDVTAGHWFTLGFTATNNGVGWFTAINGGRAAMLITPLGSANNQAQTFCASNGTANGINFNNANPEPGTYTLILDSSTGNLLFQNPNGVLRAFTLSSSDVSSIKSVQLAANNQTPVGLTFDNFVLQTTNITTPIVAPVLVSGLATINLPVSTNVFSGATVSLSGGAIGATSYDWVTDNGSGGTTWTSLGSNTNTLAVNTAPLAAGNYQYALVASNSFGMVTSSVPAMISVVVSAPNLTSDIFPISRTSYTGKAASFTAAFSGSLPISYLWQYSPNADGSGAVTVTNLAVITNNSVLLTNLTLPESGYYSVQASNSIGTLNSSWARLNVLDSAAQTNGLWVDSFSRVGALNGTTADVTNLAGAWSAVTGWTTTGSEGRATGISSGNSGHISVLPITLTAGKVYQFSFEILSLTGTAANWVSLGFFNSSSSSGTLFGNDVAVALVQVNGTGQSFFGLPALSNGSGMVAGTGGVGQYAVRLTVLASGSAIVEFIRNGLVFRTGSLTSAEVTAITGVGLAAQNNVTATFDNFRVENLPFPATPTVGAPTISPSTTVYAGTPVTVNASAGGQTPLFFQWQADNGSGGATFSNTGGNSTNLAVDTTSLLGAYQYQVIVSNLYGSITSAPVTLTVNPASAPLLTKDTRPTCVQDVPAGQNASFLARFDGTQPISYQWQFSTDAGGAGATNISGATNVMLTLTNVQIADAGYYSLQATNTVSPFVANSTWSQLAVHAGVNQLTNPPSLTYIYNDSFSRIGNVAFTSPDVVDTTGEVWYGANTAFGLDGDQLNITGGNGVAHIALVPATNSTYSVSAFLIPVCGNGSSACTVGFNTATGTSFPTDSGWIAYATSFGDGTGQTYAGASTASGSGAANSVGGPGTYTVQLTVAADGSGTVLYAKNSEIYTTNTLTSAQVNTIRSIAVLGVTTGGAVDDVKLASYSMVNTTSTNIVFSISSGSLTLSWPPDHTGWTLQMNTNLLATNWVPISGSSTTNQMIIPINPAIPTVFYRLAYP